MKCNNCGDDYDVNIRTQEIRHLYKFCITNPAPKKTTAHSESAKKAWQLRRNPCVHQRVRNGFCLDCQRVVSRGSEHA